MDDKENIEPLDDENAKILRFIEVFNAEEIEPEVIDVTQINTWQTVEDIKPPPF